MRLAVDRLADALVERVADDLDVTAEQLERKWTALAREVRGDD